MTRTSTCAQCGGEIYTRNAGMHRGWVTLQQEWVHSNPFRRHAPVLHARDKRG